VSRVLLCCGFEIPFAVFGVRTASRSIDQGTPRSFMVFVLGPLIFPSQSTFLKQTRPNLNPRHSPQHLLPGCVYPRPQSRRGMTFGCWVGFSHPSFGFLLSRVGCYACLSFDFPTRPPHPVQAGYCVNREQSPKGAVPMISVVEHTAHQRGLFVNSLLPAFP